METVAKMTVEHIWMAGEGPDDSTSMCGREWNSTDYQNEDPNRPCKNCARVAAKTQRDEPEATQIAEAVAVAIPYARKDRVEALARQYYAKLTDDNPQVRADRPGTDMYVSRLLLVGAAALIWTDLSEEDLGHAIKFWVDHHYPATLAYGIDMWISVQNELSAPADYAAKVTDEEWDRMTPFVIGTPGPAVTYALPVPAEAAAEAVTAEIMTDPGVKAARYRIEASRDGVYWVASDLVEDFHDRTLAIARAATVLPPLVPDSLFRVVDLESGSVVFTELMTYRQQQQIRAPKPARRLRKHKASKSRRRGW